MKWYQANKRDLPWRHTKDPFRIWLSEIILQQTRIDQGLPYYENFVSTFKNVEELANAKEDKILRLWQGLGYYSRARNLHKCAQVVSDKYYGTFPDTYSELLTLPGIGPYTAAAIASIAFNEAAAVIDGNVFRLLSRLFGLNDNIAIAKSRKTFESVASAMIDSNQPATFNQAIMEFGARVCKPSNPNCDHCPVNQYCYAFKNNCQATLPVNNKRLKIKERYFNYLVGLNDNKTYLHKRNAGDIWRGLYDFPLIESAKSMTVRDVLRSSDLKNIEIIKVSDEYKHILTHQRIYARFILFELKDSTFAEEFQHKFGCRVYSFNKLGALPKPRLIDKYLNDHKDYLL
ncbi:MAG: A/G-specific adenine glycosylase [Cyclobacteriaceae bacterium]